MIGITYRDEYNKYDLGIDHPLVGDKPKKTMELLKEKNILSEIEIFEPKLATEKDLLRVHTKEYVNRVKELSKTGGMLSPDTPAPIGIFNVARLAAGGTILGGKKLIEGYDIMANPLAGFHHAGKNSSSGFCFFNDIAIVIEYLREKHHLKKFLIFDVDVHHGNGTQEIYSEDPSVVNISFHQDGRTLYPGTGKLEYIGKKQGLGHTINLPLMPGTGSAALKHGFEEIVPPVIKQYKPEIIIYQSGVDTHHSDPIADLNISYQTYYILAEKMKKISEKSCNKLLVLFGGGYNGESSVKSYYNIMCGLIGRDDYYREVDKYAFSKYEKTKETVSKLKHFLEQYWDL